MPTSTSSFRIESELKLKLERAAGRTNRGKNWIINQALTEYLSHHADSDLELEAKRQSLAAVELSAGRKSVTQADTWEQAAAETWNA